MFGTSDACLASHLYQRTSETAYYILWIVGFFSQKVPNVGFRFLEELRIPFFWDLLTISVLSTDFRNH